MFLHIYIFMMSLTVLGDSEQVTRQIKLPVLVKLLISALTCFSRASTSMRSELL